MNRATPDGETVPIWEGLFRILEQEKKLGFQDRAVFGGLDKFLERWTAKARDDSGDSRRLGQALEAISALRPYSSLDADTREEVVEKALRTLSQLKKSADSPHPNPLPRGEGTVTSIPTRVSNAVPPLPLGEAARRAGEGSPVLEHRSQSPQRLGLNAGAGVSVRPGQGGESTRSASDTLKSNRSPFLKEERSQKSRPARPRAKMPSTKPVLTRGPLTLDSSVRALNGVGVSYGTKLERLGANTVKDLLYLFPHRHLDYSVMKRIKDLTIGAMESVIGTIWEVKTSRAKSGLLVITATIADETGTIQAMWFNQPHLVKTLAAGRQVVLSGRIEQNLGRPLLKSPDWEMLEAEDLTHTGRLVPVYPLTGGLGARWLRTLVKRILDRWVPELQEHLPKQVREYANLMDIQSAISQIHFPDSQQLLQRARERLVFDELFILQLGMLIKKRKWQESEPGNPFIVDRVVLERFTQTLPFQLTGAQRRVLDDIVGDLELSKPMSRLLQGDVGSGKTVVATMAMVVAWANGFQSALMAPTEILAEQHFKTVSRLVEGLAGIGARRVPSVRLLKGNVKKADKEDVYQGIASGEIDIVVGTHAVIQEGVAFNHLGLIIIDEQHRFGVMQRSLLRQKGYNPHILAMTATPIPRTLALTLYGDLDISVINEMPPGRQEIKTYLLGPEYRQRAYDFVCKQVNAGQQAFIVCPLIEESDKIEAKAATAEYERLRTRIFPDLKLGLLHGKMRAQDKDAVMEDFRLGRTDVLISTPVVEVGIDIPNATVMLIEGANRFGLAQLHQFRGRVGRGTEKSYCLLLADSPSSEAEERLQVITQTQDGFALAEEDLRLRGPGEFFGTRQSGMPDLRIAGLSDVGALERARAAAIEFFRHDPGLQQSEHRLLAQQVARFWQVEGELN